MEARKCFLGIILIASVIGIIFAEYDELCGRFKDGVQFREPGNCQAYVTCKNATGKVSTCPNNQFYDKDKSKCVDELKDSYCQDICKSKSDVWMSDPTNCHGYFFCQSGKAIHGACPDDYHFDESKQLCVFSSDSGCTGISDFCGILPNSVPFSDPDNCNKYFQCSKGSLKSTTCSSGLYYDVVGAKCKSMYEVTCKAHPIPENVCGKDKRPIYDSFVEDRASCRGYYYCSYKGAKISDKKPTWNQCDEGLFFNEQKQACHDPVETSCKHNRCEGRGNLKVIAEDWGCRYYYACRDGLVLEKRKCLKNMFFDETKQACTLDETSYSVCDY